MAKKRGLVFWWMTLALIGCVAVGVTLKTSAFAQIDQELKEYDLFLDVLNTVSSNYVFEDKAQKDVLLRGAIEGMMSTLDRYSVFLPPQEKEDLDIQTKGKYMGIGMHIAVIDGWLTAVSPIPGGPAFRKGILSGDKIIRINGISTRGLTADQAVKVLRGPKGTKVSITTLRKDDPKAIDYSIIRDEIHIPTLEYKMMPSDMGYIRLYEFREDASVLLQDALDDLEEQGMRGLVLDLRFNTGGLLDEAIKIAGKFLEEGAVVVSTRPRNPAQEMVYRNNEKLLFTKPMVLMVNQDSASASEIVAGAIQDHKRAPIIGPVNTTTYGKGSVQSIIELKFGNAIKLTTAKYFTPSGRSIDMEGIVPDIGVNISLDQQRQIMAKNLIGTIPESATAELTGMAFEQEEMAKDHDKADAEERFKQMLKSAEAEIPSATKDEDVITVDEVFKEDQMSEEAEATYDLELMEALRMLRAGMMITHKG